MKLPRIICTDIFLKLFILSLVAKQKKLASQEFLLELNLWLKVNEKYQTCPFSPFFQLKTSFFPFSMLFIIFRNEGALLRNAFLMTCTLLIFFKRPPFKKMFYKKKWSFLSMIHLRIFKEILVFGIVEI